MAPDGCKGGQHGRSLERNGGTWERKTTFSLALVRRPDVSIVTREAHCIRARPAPSKHWLRESSIRGQVTKPWLVVHL